MVDEGWGRIVNIASVSAYGDPERVAYASAKAGLIGMTRMLALELGPYGITVNAIAPGFVVSDMTAATARRLGRSFAEHQRLVAFFIGDDAGYVSGQILDVAGGPAG